jgi:transcriptional regulator with XRE-family HTH domain
VAVPSPELIGQCLESARKAAGLTQVALARASQINRIQIVRIEAGLTVPRLDETVRLAEVLKVPLSRLTSSWAFPRPDLRGIAIELHWLGIKDLEVANPEVPGSFRHKEEVLALAVSGDSPEPRVVEAIPFLLARQKFRASLVSAFAGYHDRRARGRIAWLSSVTLALGRVGSLPFPVESELHLGALIRQGAKSREPDSLGHPGKGKFSPIWRRWNITYAGTVQDFLHRSIEVHTAFKATPTVLGDRP